MGYAKKKFKKESLILMRGNIAEKYAIVKTINLPEDKTKIIANALYYNNYRKLPEDSVVLAREVINNTDYFYVKDGQVIPCEKGVSKLITVDWYTELLKKMPLKHELARERKETAEKIADWLETSDINGYSLKAITERIRKEFSE